MTKPTFAFRLRTLQRWNELIPCFERLLFDKAQSLSFTNFDSNPQLIFCSLKKKKSCKQSRNLTTKSNEKLFRTSFD